MALMATPINLRSKIPITRRDRMSVSYSNAHDDGCIRVRSGIDLPTLEVLATSVPGIRRRRLGIVHQ